MEINYTYKLVGVKKVASLSGLTDVVISADFIITAEVPGVPKFDWAMGDVPVDFPNSADFKPFDQLTEEEILSWVQTIPQTAGVKDQLRRSINELLAGKEYVAWNNQPTLMETQDPIIP